jgi:hypothetical protein
MPFLDRSWWLRIAGGLALIVAALALSNAWTASARAAKSAAGSPWPGALFTLLIPLLALVVALWLSYGALQARERASARRGALAGDLTAMPPAVFAGDPTTAPDLTQEPLVVMWRPHHAIQRAVWLIALLTLALDATIVYGARQILGVKLPVPIDPNSFWLRLAIISAGLLLPALHLALLLAAPLALRLRTGAIFTDQGVQERTRWGRRRFLRWEDALLFEVEAVQELDRRYTLYGARGAVHWMDEIPAYDSEAIQQRDHENYAPDGITKAEMSRRLRAALSLVAARTTLTPHTLSPALQTGRIRSRQTAARSALRVFRLTSAGPLGSALLTALALPLLFLPAALGITFAHWPPTASPTVNLISGLALVAASEVLLVAIALALSGESAMRGAQYVESEQGFDASEEPPLPASATGVMPLPGSYLNRRWTVALGLLLLVGGVPGIILLCLLCAEYLSILFFPRQVTALIAAFPQTPGALSVAALSLCVGVIGLGLACLALSTDRPWSRQVQVDADGLRIVQGAITRELPWDAVETLSLTVVGATPKSYRLTADTGKISLSWPAQADARLGSAPPKGALVVSPAGLAALIERQPGVKRSIRVIGAPQPELEARLTGPGGSSPDLPALLDR